jgi:glutathione S-transferase
MLSVQCRLFFAELGIEYKNEYYNYDAEWKTKRDELKLNLTGTLPVLDIDGHRLSQVCICSGWLGAGTFFNCDEADTLRRLKHLPILRYLSRRAGGYDGETNYEKFIVDAVSDVYIDYRVSPSAINI